MSTFADVKAVRLVINDPPGLVNIDQVADEVNLPATPMHQTSYQSISTGKYYVTEKATGATIADYTQPELWLSDIIISDLFDTLGHDVTVYRALRLILARVGAKLRAESITNGQDSTAYTSLRETHDYYKSLIDIFKEQKNEGVNAQAGVYKSFKRPRIAGGNL